MDHLPRPGPRNYCGDAALRSPRTILLLNLHADYPPSAFEDYPALRGFAPEVLAEGSFKPEQTHRAAAAFQNWLFFGLMEAAFKNRVHANDFIEDDQEGGHMYLHTRALQRHLVEWETHISRSNPTERAEWAEHTSLLFKRASDILEDFTSDIHKFYPKDFAVQVELLASLLEVLEYSRHAFFPDTPPRNKDNINGDCSLNFKHEFLQKGWCPYTIKHVLLSNPAPSILDYARLFKSNPSFITKCHKDCQPDYCAVTNVDTATYTPKHVFPGCDCQYLRPKMAEIESAINAGCIPVITLTNTNEIVTMGVQWQNSDTTPYVAISHVWAEGLGSCSEKGLPACQIQKLKKAACEAQQKVHGAGVNNTAFWIDALCIPESQDLRRQAIGLMEKTYAKASVVLVLDESIGQLLLGDPLHEKMFTIYVSSWVQRLWTLQEMMVARELVFQISNAMLDYQELFPADIVNLSGRDPLTTELFGWLATLLMNSSSLNRPRVVDLDMIIWHLSRRTSSRESDEILAIAGLFGLDASKYVPLDAEERMFKFLKEHAESRVPTDLIFLPGDKLSRPGRRWAPRKFIASEKSGTPKSKFHDERAAVMDVGLFGRWQCLVLKERLVTNSVPSAVPIIVSQTQEELVIELDRTSIAEGPEYMDLIVSREDDGESDRVPGLAGLVREEEEIGEDGEVVLVVDLGSPLVLSRPKKLENSMTPSTRLATREQRFLLLR